jgi:transposase InsO family protein
MAGLCRRHGISRECGHKWWRRFQADGLAGLRPGSRRPRASERMRERWQPRLIAAKRTDPDFGPKKLYWRLRRDYPRERSPGVRTLARWLAQSGQVRLRKRRARPGPAVRLPGRLAGCRINDVWTIDLKGKFSTRNGRRVNALTVRDLASRFVLCVRHVGRGSERQVGPLLRALFRRYGLPRVLRLDNGSPFGSFGPRGWTRLSTEWIRLGLRLEYGRPGCPQDNAAHEQMHRMLKERTARPAAANVPAQQRRFDRWRWRYNHARPHESLGMRVPAERYQRSPRTLPAPLPAWSYPPAWLKLRPDAKGRWRWRGRARQLGRAFAQQDLGARPGGPDMLIIYFGPHALGTLHAGDRAGLRPVRWRLPTKQNAGGAAPLPNPP